jgi:hypothetical protein
VDECHDRCAHSQLKTCKGTTLQLLHGARHLSHAATCQLKQHGATSTSDFFFAFYFFIIFIIIRGE